MRVSSYRWTKGPPEKMPEMPREVKGRSEGEEGVPIVNAVPSDSHNCSSSLTTFHYEEFLLRTCAREHNFWMSDENLIQLSGCHLPQVDTVYHCCTCFAWVDFGYGNAPFFCQIFHRFARWRNNAHHARYCFRCYRVVSGHHDHPNAGRATLGHL